MRVLAVNDISCVGKCSLGATLPVISACGVECNVLPTALLSTHTGGFEGYTFHDLTEDIPDILRHWKRLGLTFDVLYSGYLVGTKQIEFVSALKREFLKKDGLFVVDPVMGDDGKLYAGFSPDYVDAMRALCLQADYILPNATEACLLTELSYPLGDESANEAVERLKKLCAHPVVTGVTDGGRISLRYADSEGKVCKLEHEKINGFFCGAGDVFASAFVGALARGKSQEDAVRLASEFTTAAIRRSEREVPDKRFGLNFEAEIFPFLQKLNGEFR